VEDINIQDELEQSYLEYALSVIVSRAIPDARDGLKPVQRRLLFAMLEGGQRSDKPHRKSVSAVGDTMKKFHPHGDQSIYDTLVRLAQPWSMRVTLIDGHGNFGSRDDGPAAYRYTEARLDRAAEALLESVDENTVDMVANFDSSSEEPVVLPAGFPNLLVNGASGIAVGMATNIPPNNLNEIAAACAHLLEHPKASSGELLKFVHGPDFPTGGVIVGTDGLREAYLTGKGAIKVRAKCSIEDVSPRKRGIVVTELPYNVGPERVIARIKEVVSEKKVDGIADVKDLSDRKHGLRLVIEVRAGFDPQAVLARLFKLTPLEENFSVNAVALIGGKPQVSTLVDLCRAYIDHRLEVVVRRSRHRLARAEARAHIVEGLLIALSAIDEVVAIIRSSKDTDAARKKLCSTLKLTVVQADAVLEMPLRRLTSLEVGKLRGELKELQTTIKALKAIIASPVKQRAVVREELDEAVRLFGSKRRTTIQKHDDLAEISEAVNKAAIKASITSVAPGASEPAHGAQSAVLQLPDEPCVVAATASGVARVVDGGKGSPVSVISSVATTLRSRVGVIRADGTMVAIEASELAEVASRGKGAFTPLAAFASQGRIVGVVALDREIAMGTRFGVVKRLASDATPTEAQFNRAGKDGVAVIQLAEGDELAGAVNADDTAELVFVSAQAQLLRFPANSVRAQGRSSSGMAGMKLAEGDEVLVFCAPTTDAAVVTSTDAGNVKWTPLAEYPPKGRSTMGVRCHSFKKGDSALGSVVVAARIVGAPSQPSKRDASGVPGDTPYATV
jgi:DNA gyrase subunit A